MAAMALMPLPLGQIYLKPDVHVEFEKIKSHSKFSSDRLLEHLLCLYLSENAEQKAISVRCDLACKFSSLLTGTNFQTSDQLMRHLIGLYNSSSTAPDKQLDSSENEALSVTNNGILPPLLHPVKTFHNPSSEQFAAEETRRKLRTQLQTRNTTPLPDSVSSPGTSSSPTTPHRPPTLTPMVTLTSVPTLTSVSMENARSNCNSGNSMDKVKSSGFDLSLVKVEAPSDDEIERKKEETDNQGQPGSVLCQRSPGLVIPNGMPVLKKMKVNEGDSISEPLCLKQSPTQPSSGNVLYKALTSPQKRLWPKSSLSPNTNSAMSPTKSQNSASADLQSSSTTSMSYAHKSDHREWSVPTTLMPGSASQSIPVPLSLQYVGNDHRSVRPNSSRKMPATHVPRTNNTMPDHNMNIPNQNYTYVLNSFANPAKNNENGLPQEDTPHTELSPEQDTQPHYRDEEEETDTPQDLSIRYSPLKHVKEEEQPQNLSMNRSQPRQHSPARPILSRVLQGNSTVAQSNNTDSAPNLSPAIDPQPLALCPSDPVKPHIPESAINRVQLIPVVRQGVTSSEMTNPAVDLIPIQSVGPPTMPTVPSLENGGSRDGSLVIQFANSNKTLLMPLQPKRKRKKTEDTTKFRDPPEESLPFNGPNKFRFYCDVCDTGFTRRYTYNRHKCKGKVEKHYCQLCDKAYLSKYKLKDHVLVKHQGQMVACPDCGKRFSSRSSMEMHKKQQHEGMFSIFCKICGKGFNHTGHYYGHMNKHNNTKPFWCQQCGKRFYGSSYLHNHKQVCKANKIKVFECHLCDRKFKCDLYLKKHLQSHDGQPVLDNSAVTGMGSNETSGDEGQVDLSFQRPEDDDSTSAIAGSL